MQRHYQLSPFLNLSYTQAAKNLYIATRIASLPHTLCGFAMLCFAGSDYHLALDYKKQMTIKLWALASKNLIRFGVTRSWAYAPIVEDQLLSADDACLCLPNISPKQIQEKCPASPETLGPMIFRLGDVADMFLEQCGCIEEYQEAIINDLEKDIPGLVKCMHYINRAWRLA